MYGNFGLRRWPWYEYIRLPVFAITVLPLRVTVLAIVSVSLRVAAAIQTMLGTRAARVYAHINGMFSCMTGVVCGFGVLPRVIVVDAPPAGCPDRFTENGVLMRPPLVISNHSSYVDVAMMSGLLYPSFVARAGTEKLPFYGPVSKTIRCILVRLATDRGFQPCTARERRHPRVGRRRRWRGSAPRAQRARRSRGPRTATTYPLRRSR